MKDCGCNKVDKAKLKAAKKAKEEAKGKIVRK